MDITPEQRALQSEERSFPIYGVIFGVVAVAACLTIGGFVYWTEFHKYDAVYARLGIKPLGRAVEKASIVNVQLQQLERDACDRTAIVALATALAQLGQKEQGDIAISNFAGSCIRSTARSGTGAVQPVSPYDRMIEELTLSTDPAIRKAALQHRDTPCSQPIALELIGRLNTANAFRPAAEIGTTFLNACARDTRIGFNSGRAMFWKGDYVAALRMVELFPNELSTSYEFASLRGFILEKMNRHAEAAESFDKALLAMPDLSRTALAQFHYATRAYREAGQYCKGIKPLELYLSFDPQKRMTGEISSILADLRQRGNCPT